MPSFEKSEKPQENINEQKKANEEENLSGKILNKVIETSRNNIRTDAIKPKSGTIVETVVNIQSLQNQKETMMKEQVAQLTRMLIELEGNVNKR